MNGSLRLIMFICFMGFTVPSSYGAFDTFDHTISKEKMTLMSQLYTELELAQQKGDVERVDFLRRTISALVDTMNNNQHKKKRYTPKEIVIFAGLLVPMVIVAWKTAYSILNNQLKKDATTVRNDLAHVAAVLHDDTMTLVKAFDNRLTQSVQALDNRLVQVAGEGKQLIQRVQEGTQTMYRDGRSFVRWGGALLSIGATAFMALRAYGLL